MPYAAPRICRHGAVVGKAGSLCPACVAAKKAKDDGRVPARQRGYDSAWDKARRGFLAHHSACVICCAPATDVDHKVPHKGDKALFWDKTNWQALCHPCHSRKTAKFDRQA